MASVDLLPDNVTEWANSTSIIEAPTEDKINQGWTGRTDDYAFATTINYLQNQTDRRLNNFATTINAMLVNGVPPHNMLYQYGIGSVVMFNGNMYIAKQANAGQAPQLGISDEYWEVVKNSTYLTDQLDTKANIASPTFTGTPKAPTASSGNNTLQIANTQWVNTEMAKRVRGTSELNLTLKDGSKAYPIVFAKNNKYTDTHITKSANDTTGNMDLVIRGIGGGLDQVNTSYFEMINLNSTKDVNVKSFVKKVQMRSQNSEIVVWLKGGVTYTINQREGDDLWELIETTTTLNDNWIINVEEWTTNSAISDGTWNLTKQDDVLIDSSSVSDTGSIDTCGMIVAYPVETLPSGALLCDGSEVSRTIYAKLFNKIGVKYGVGDGTTTFNLPDLRGMAIVGLDMGRNIDSNQLVTALSGGSEDRTALTGLGSSQSDAIRDFTGQFKISGVEGGIDGFKGVFEATTLGGYRGDIANLRDSGSHNAMLNLSNSIPVTTGDKARNQVNNVALLWIIYYI